MSDKEKTIEKVLVLLQNAQEECVDGQKHRERLAVRRRLLADLGKAYREAAGADAKRVASNARWSIDVSAHNVVDGIIGAKANLPAK